MSSPPGKIAVVQVSSGASCNALLSSTRRRIPLRGPTPRNRWPDFSPENRLASRYACPELPPPEGLPPRLCKSVVERACCSRFPAERECGAWLETPNGLDALSDSRDLARSKGYLTT